jgi:hypothetical protein
LNVPTLTVNPPQTSNGKTNNNVAKANTDETDEPSTPVIKNFCFIFSLMSFSI